LQRLHRIDQGAHIAIVEQFFRSVNRAAALAAGEDFILAGQVTCDLAAATLVPETDPDTAGVRGRANKRHFRCLFALLVYHQ
jgi:hypothetical protein